MTYLQSILLGILQGVGEFLPISSSGHLVLAERSFGITPSLTVNVFLHMGTLGAIVTYYWKDVMALTKDAVLLPLGKLDAQRRAFLLKLGLATVITAALGLMLEEPIERLFASSAGNLWLGSMFFFTGLILVTLFWMKHKGGVSQPTWVGALLIGIVQGVAVFPGISRSGSTIVMAMVLGLSGVAAARFSFLLAIPVIAGAGILQAVHLTSISTPGPVAVSVVTAFLVGFASLWFLVKIINKGKLAWFSFYCLPLAVYVCFFGK